MSLFKALAIFCLAINAISFELPQGEREGSRGYGRRGHGHHGHHGHRHGSGPYPMGPPFPSPLERDHHKHGGPPPPAPFLRNITDQARREFFEIQMNPNSTKAEVNQKLDQWAEVNRVKDQYDNFTTTLKNFAQKYHDLAVANLAGEALQLYLKLWDIRQDEQITGSQECDEVKNTLNSTSPDFDFVIHSFLPPPINIGKCAGPKHKPHPKHRPFHGKSSSTESDDNENGHQEPPYKMSFGGHPKGDLQNNKVDQQSGN